MWFPVLLSVMLNVFFSSYDDFIEIVSIIFHNADYA